MEEPFKNYGTTVKPLYIVSDVLKSFGLTNLSNQKRYIQQFKTDEVIRNFSKYVYIKRTETIFDLYSPSST